MEPVHTPVEWVCRRIVKQTTGQPGPSSANKLGGILLHGQAIGEVSRPVGAGNAQHFGDKFGLGGHARIFFRLLREALNLFGDEDSGECLAAHRNHRSCLPKRCLVQRVFLRSSGKTRVS